MTVVVTGAAGFLPSHVVDLILDRGDSVIGIDNLVTGRLANLAHVAHHPRFTFINHDATQPLTVDGHVDAVLHMASPASPKDFDRLPFEIMAVNSIGTANALNLALSHNARFVLASTSEVYGDPLVHPQPESYRGNVSTTGPRSPYDESKRFAETLAFMFRRQHGLDARVVRTFNTYGPRMRLDDGRVVPNFIGQALANIPLTVYGDGSQTRSLCYVADQAAGYVAVLDADHLDAPVNIGNDHELSMKELANEVIQLTGSSSSIEFKPLPTDDPTQRNPELTRAKSLGWQPTTSFRDGIGTTIEYFRAELAKQCT